MDAHTKPLVGHCQPEMLTQCHCIGTHTKSVGDLVIFHLSRWPWDDDAEKKTPEDRPPALRRCATKTPEAVARRISFVDDEVEEVNESGAGDVQQLALATQGMSRAETREYLQKYVKGKGRGKGRGRGLPVGLIPAPEEADGEGGKKAKAKKDKKTAGAEGEQVPKDDGRKSKRREPELEETEKVPKLRKSKKQGEEDGEKDQEGGRTKKKKIEEETGEGDEKKNEKKKTKKTAETTDEKDDNGKAGRKRKQPDGPDERTAGKGKTVPQEDVVTVNDAGDEITLNMDRFDELPPEVKRWLKAQREKNTPSKKAAKRVEPAAKSTGDKKDVKGDEGAGNEPMNPKDKGSATGPYLQLSHMRFNRFNSDVRKWRW